MATSKVLARWQRDRGIVPGEAGAIASFIAENNAPTDRDARSLKYERRRSSRRGPGGEPQT